MAKGVITNTHIGVLAPKENYWPNAEESSRSRSKRYYNALKKPQPTSR